MPIVVLSVDACTLAVKQINTKEDVIKYFEIGFNPDPQIETGMRVQVFDFTVCSKNIRFTRRLIEYFWDMLWSQRLVLSSCFYLGIRV